MTVAIDVTLWAWNAKWLFRKTNIRLGAPQQTLYLVIVIDVLVTRAVNVSQFDFLHASNAYEAKRLPRHLVGSEDPSYLCARYNDVRSLSKELCAGKWHVERSILRWNIGRRGVNNLRFAPRRLLQDVSTTKSERVILGGTLCWRNVKAAPPLTPAAIFARRSPHREILDIFGGPKEMWLGAMYDNERLSEKLVPISYTKMKP